MLDNYNTRYGNETCRLQTTTRKNDWFDLIDGWQQ